MLTRLAYFCFRYRLQTVAGWTAGLIILGVLAGVAAGVTSDDYTIPGSDSQKALQVLRAHGLSDDQTGALRVVFRDPAGLTSPADQDAIGSTLDRLKEKLPGAQIVAPFTPTGRHQVSPDRTVAYAELQLRTPNGSELSDTELSKVPDKVEQVAPSVRGLDIAFAGAMFQAGGGGGPAEGVGLLAAVVILLVAFGSVLAMGLPVLVALFGAGCGVTAVILVANVVDMSAAAVPLAAMLAVGVGIDYSLLIVTRYREGLAEGLEPGDAVLRSQQTAGRSVLFAGTTVVIAVLGLLTMNMPLVNGIAIGAALAVAITMAASLTMLPALLGFVGTNIDRLGTPHRRGSAGGDGRLAHRWSRSVQRRPATYAVVSLVVLAALTVPAFALRLGFSDAGTLPTSNTTRQAYDMLAGGFGPGVNGPLFAVVDASPEKVDAASLATLRERIVGTSGVESVTTAILSGDREVAMLVVTPATGPSDAATADLVRKLSNTVIPDTDLRSARGHLTGQTAAVVDFSNYTASRLPAFLAVVMVVAFLLLAVAFRSVLVPVKAVVVNLLSIGASLGVLVAALQWGWASGLFGLDQPSPVIVWVPMMMIAVVFGLSMDYEVFLLSRIKEHHDLGEPNDQAVASGLAGTARVITAAAAIMICVFASFMLGSAIDLAVFGFGLAVAVFIDATLVRMVLVPAVMELLGERNWWLPGWLDGILPRSKGTAL